MIKGYNRAARGGQARGRGGGRGRGLVRGERGARERAAARGTAWGVRRDATKRTRNSSESDGEQSPPTRTRSRGRGSYSRSSTATGANRVELGARPAQQQITEALEENENGDEEEMEVLGEPVGHEPEVGVRVGVEEESEVVEIPSQLFQQS
jgi:hypothetical protein